MIERIDELRSEAEGAIAAAGSTAALEELRVRYLGRKAELPNLLRGVAQLPPEERGTVGRAANQARQALEALIEARAGELEAGELDARLAADRVDVTLPGEPPQPVGRLHVLTATLARARGRLRRPRLHGRRGARGRDRPLQLRRAQPQPDAPRARPDRHLLRRRRRRPADPHLADAGARDGGPSAAALRRHPRAHLPPRQRRHAHADVPPGRGPGRRRGHHAGRPQGHAAGLRARRLRRGARGAPAPALLPLHRALASRSTSRASSAAARATWPTARAATSAAARAGSRSSAPARSTPTSTPTSTTTATTPRRSRASPGGWGSSAWRCSSTASPTCACTTTTTCASWSSSDDGSRSSGSQEYADPGLPVRALEERLTMTGTKVEAVHHHGVDALERFVIGKVLEAGRHPDADRLSVCLVDVGDDGPQQIVCGAPNVAAGQTVAVARPGAVMPDGTKLGVAKLRGVESNGMILAEDELGIGDRARGDHGPRRAARGGGAAGRACCRSPPTCSSSRSRPTAPTAWASTASRARSTPPPARRWRRRPGPRTSAAPATSPARRSSSRPPTCARASPRAPSRT